MLCHLEMEPDQKDRDLAAAGEWEEEEWVVVGVEEGEEEEWEAPVPEPDRAEIVFAPVAGREPLTR